MSLDRTKRVSQRRSAVLVVFESRWPGVAALSVGPCQPPSNIMDASPARTSFPARAVASIVFACSSLLLWRTYFHLHYTVLGRLGKHITDPVRGQLAYTQADLAIAYRGLAVTALVWCVLSWRSEARAAAVVCSLFTGLAVAINLWMLL